MTKFCFSISTIPQRYKTIYKTIESLLNQTHHPNKIIINYSDKYVRFPDEKINHSELFKKNYDDKIIFNKSEDYGPGTKLLGSLNQIKDCQYIILLDDDHIYKKNMLEIFATKTDLKSDNAYSFCTYSIEDLVIGQGADGFMIRTDLLKNIKEFFNKYVKNNKSLFLNDDLWISIYINKILKKKIINLENNIELNFFKKLFRRGKSIYKKHTKVNSLINEYSKIGKEARMLRYNDSLDQYNSLKLKTLKFTKI